jgi:hypothetical protein
VSSTEETGPEARMVMVDGREASAYVILRPGPKQGTVLLEAATTEGTDHHQIAQALRHIADQWSPRPGLQGVLDEIAVHRARQRTAFGGDEHRLPDGTGQYPETIGADVAQMSRDSAREGGYLDWFHVVRAAAAQAFAEARTTELRADLINLSAFTAGWIEAIDLRTGHQAGGLNALMTATADQPPADDPEDLPAGTPVERPGRPLRPGAAGTTRIYRHPLRLVEHNPAWLSCDIHRAGFSHTEDCPGHGTPGCITLCAGGEPDDAQLLGLAVELLATAPRVGDLLTPGGAVPPSLARTLAPLLNQPDGGRSLTEVVRQDLVAVARVLLGRNAA